MTRARCCPSESLCMHTSRTVEFAQPTEPTYRRGQNVKLNIVHFPALVGRTSCSASACFAIAFSVPPGGMAGAPKPIVLACKSNSSHQTRKHCILSVILYEGSCPMPSSCYAKLHLPFAKTLGYDCNAACMYRISTRADGARAGPSVFYLPAKKIIISIWRAMQASTD